MKKKNNIVFNLVQNVRKLEKNNKKVHYQWKQTLSQYEKLSSKEIRKEKKTENVLF